MKDGLRRLMMSGLASLLAVGCLVGCSGLADFDDRNKILVSVDEQRMILVRDEQPLRQYSISTSKFGLGDQPGSYRTPMGRMRVEDKIGAGQPAGMVFRGRQPTGEVLRPNAPGRDPIVSRILWLRGLEAENRNAYGRYIYIHGTAEERSLGTPASYGCIRMSSEDVIELYDLVGEGASVEVKRGRLPYRQGMFGGWSATGTEAETVTVESEGRDRQWREERG